MRSIRVSDTIFLNALPSAWKVEEVRCPQATPGSIWRRRYLREVTCLQIRPGFEYLRIGETHKFHETELWCSTAKGDDNPHYRTLSGRTLWRRHNPNVLKKPTLP